MWLLLVTKRTGGDKGKLCVHDNDSDKVKPLLHSTVLIQLAVVIVLPVAELDGCIAGSRQFETVSFLH